MARNKNALRKHLIADVETDSPETEPTEFFELAKWILTVSDETEEDTESEGFYDGDGTPETSVNSVAGAYSFEGYYDPEDEAQALIASKKYKPQERKVWHKVINTDGTETVGIATVTGIIAGAGDATAFEEFGCTITYDSLPKTKEATPEA